MHQLMGAASPILIGHQGFPVAHNHHQFFGEGVYPPGTVSPAVISSGLNDTPLEFNLTRNKPGIVVVVMHKSSHIVSLWLILILYFSH